MSSSTIREVAERAWQGELGDLNVHPALAVVGIEPVSDALVFVGAFSNLAVVRTREGLVLLDTSGPFHAAMNFEAIRRLTDARVHTAIYTHGHVDHVFGLAPFEDEARDKGWPAPEVLAHEACVARFDRYRLTPGYNGHVNARQFGLPVPVFPTEFRYPDRTVRDALTLQVADTVFEIHHDRGETDDHLWIWLPRERAIYTGDLFIWASPNCGNPQKVQRYPREWAVALRRMAALGAQTLMPGHGPPIFGEARVQAALTDAAELLESLVSQTLAMMNEGATLDDVMHGVRLPEALLARPYLRPVYDDPLFIVRNLWRLYGGWYDGNPSRLKPARDAEVAKVITELAGGPEQLLARARLERDAGRLDVACHLVEQAHLAAPGTPAVRALRTDLYTRRAETETSLMAKAIFRAAARETAD